MDEKLTKKVIRTGHGYYKLKDTYRKPMQRFYEEKYYQDDYASYRQKYDKVDLDYRNNIFRQKLAILEKCGGGYRKNQTLFSI